MLSALRVTSSNFNPRPREEGDGRCAVIIFFLRDFNPRPREEGDVLSLQGFPKRSTFQSTPS